MSDWPFLNRHRARVGQFASSDSDGFNGFFFFPLDGEQVKVVSSDGHGWQHVSISLRSRKIPSWDQMCKIKDLFFEPEDCVVQFHPARSQYVNMHAGCLHLWRSTAEKQPTPPFWMV